jgi:hypothetical protein
VDELEKMHPLAEDSGARVVMPALRLKAPLRRDGELVPGCEKMHPLAQYHVTRV